jgi:hypothetical protein
MVLIYFNIFYLMVVFSFGFQNTRITAKIEISTAQKINFECVVCDNFEYLHC